MTEQLGVHEKPFRLEEATIEELHAAITSGQTTCVAIVQHYIDRARAYNGVASALVTEDGAPIPEAMGALRAQAPLRFPTTTVTASAVLPVAVLALRPTSHFLSAVREGMLEALGAEHVVAARSRGLSRAQAVWKHVIPNGLLPLTTLAAVWFAGLLGGSVIVEVIFAIPGMGRLMFDGVLNSDIPLAQGAVVVVVGLAVLLTTAADLIHGLLNPQVRMLHA